MTRRRSAPAKTKFDPDRRPSTPTARASQDRHLFHGAARPRLDEDAIAALYRGRRYEDVPPHPAPRNTKDPFQ